MAFHPLVLFVHLLGAVVLIASSLHGPFVRAAIRRTNDVATVRAWLRFAHEAARANPIAALVVLATGVYLGLGRWSEAWLVVSLVLFVASSAIAIAIVDGTMRRLEQLAASAPGGSVGEAIEGIRASLAWDRGGDALLANDVALVFLMVQQPGLAGSLATVLVAHAAAVAYRLVRRRHAAGCAVSRAVGGQPGGLGA